MMEVSGGVNADEGEMPCLLPTAVNSDAPLGREGRAGRECGFHLFNPVG